VIDMEEMDQFVLSQIEAEFLSPEVVDSLVALVNDAPNDRDQLIIDREQLVRERGSLVRHIAKGTITDSDVHEEMERINDRLGKVEAALRRPRRVNMDKAQMRAALEQQCAHWREVLRGEPRIARLLVKKILGTIEIAPVHLGAGGSPWWSIPGGVPSPDTPAPSVAWRAEAKPEALLEDISTSSGTGV
jgi:hypothetical protein